MHRRISLATPNVPARCRSNPARTLTHLACTTCRASSNNTNSSPKTGNAPVLAQESGSGPARIAAQSAQHMQRGAMLPLRTDQSREEFPAPVASKPGLLARAPVVPVASRYLQVRGGKQGRSSQRGSVRGAGGEGCRPIAGEWPEGRQAQRKGAVWPVALGPRMRLATAVLQKTRRGQ